MRPLLLAFACIISSLSFAQNSRTIEGILQDEKGELIPFANVYVQGSTIGTTTNMEGVFILKTPNNQKLEIVFQYIGFIKKVVSITFWDNKTQPVIVLEKENFELSTFTVTANGKDPAYAIIKQAQKKRKKHLKQLDAYSGKVYMKGGLYLDQIPESIPLLISSEDMPDSSELGLVGLTESVANFYFAQPDNYKEEMLASKISGFSNGYSWNRVNQVIYNFYENLIKIPGLSDREFLSPIASTAMATYDFKLEGTFKENDYTVNKILVTPKRPADLAFDGYIYITEELWNIYAIDLSVQKPTPLKLADTVRFKQNYALISDDIWLPRSLEMEVYFKFLGFGINYHAVGMFSNYDIQPNFDKNFFSNEVFVVTDTVKKIDSTFWEQSRQVELSTEEKTNYFEGDSIEKRMNSPAYLDSLDAKHNKLKIGKLLLQGYNHRNRYKKRNWSIDPLISIVQFNTVEGLVIQPYITINDYSDRNAKGQYDFGLRYGHLTKTFSPQFAYTRSVNQKKLSGIGFEAGETMRQINNVNPIAEEFNTYYTLFAEQNFAKYYRSRYAKFRYQHELVNGWLAGISVGYESRISERNRTNYTWKNVEHRDFISNIGIKENNSLTFNFVNKITFKQKYETYPDKKVVVGSTWPDLYVISNNAIAISSNDVSYNQIKLAIDDNISLGNVGRFYYTGAAGKFLNQKNLSFVDYEHFNGNQVVFTPELMSAKYDLVSPLENRLKFHTLPFYSMSTSNAFVEAHVEHHFNGFIVNKLPLIRRTKFQTIAGANALYTDAKKEFTELYLGVDNIFGLIRVDFAAGYVKGGKIEPVYRIALKASF
jgi:hypothetical protein